jgi:molybdate transport system substrate-binding protein
MRFLRRSASSSAGRILIAALLVWVSSACYGQAAVTLTISAAASLKESIAENEAAYSKSHPNIDFTNNSGSSGTLATQIDQGAPVDVFLSAATKQMDDLEAKGLVVKGTRRNLLRNTLVLVAPLDSKLKDFEGLTDGSVRVIAVGDPGSVPAGQYGRQTLTALKLWDKLGSKFVLAKDVRQVLTYVETGNADAGLVYATDAKGSSKVRVVATAPESTHDAIVYPAAVIEGSRNAEAAREFVDYLASPAAQAVFARYGFTIAAP